MVLLNLMLERKNNRTEKTNIKAIVLDNTKEYVIIGINDISNLGLFDRLKTSKDQQSKALESDLIFSLNLPVEEESLINKNVDEIIPVKIDGEHTNNKQIESVRNLIYIYENVFFVNDVN
ncbi:hypothetical protein EDEG_02417 [Edhazardia aedis USNM 41457]|uniref:Uncharacterized protein n=1 Tax=Edhazardia aedis (strain USNM 41457) TaxID=1003232 RepID=J9DPD5_EDHAE|nr:hypothetical protein EDEG_02417 [Edhazardia aedis USNM 41457]|eukprot:EJW03202.1 hypothetical protein EDEG_02417 [Edhazardia aedis USNM 41457]